MGDFFGGLANALALVAILVALLAQQREFAETVRLQRELQHHEMVREYYLDGDGDKQVAARKFVYEHSPDELVNADESYIVIRFFHTWGMLVECGAMPHWVFLETATGDRVLELHNRLTAHIEKQVGATPNYAKGFLYLVKGIQQRTFK